MKHHVTWDGALKPHPLSRCALLRALIVELVGGALSAGCLAVAAVDHLVVCVPMPRVRVYTAHAFAF